jgi:hypothetical protein
VSSALHNVIITWVIQPCVPGATKGLWQDLQLAAGPLTGQHRPLTVCTYRAFVVWLAVRAGNKTYSTHHPTPHARHALHCSQAPWLLLLRAAAGRQAAGCGLAPAEAPPGPGCAERPALRHGLAQELPAQGVPALATGATDSCMPRIMQQCLTVALAINLPATAFWDPMVAQAMLVIDVICGVCCVTVLTTHVLRARTSTAAGGVLYDGHVSGG